MNTFLTKYRPDSLESFLGNPSCVSAIKGLVRGADKSGIPISWLFTGRSGIGKTTMARILVGEFGVESAAVIEINAASANSVDSIRKLEGQVRNGILGTSRMAVILDECHQLTSAAQQCLLKLLEDAKNAYFILCTTEVSKLLDTIITRCAVFNFLGASQEELHSLIGSILQRTSKNIEVGVLEELVVCSGGSFRLCLSLLERILGVDNIEEQKQILKNSLESAVSFGEEAVHGVSRELADWFFSPSKYDESRLVDLLAEVNGENFSLILGGLVSLVSGGIRSKRLDMIKAVLILADNPCYSRAVFVARLWLAFEKVLEMRGGRSPSVSDNVSGKVR